MECGSLPPPLAKLKFRSCARHGIRVKKMITNKDYENYSELEMRVMAAATATAEEYGDTGFEFCFEDLMENEFVNQLPKNVVKGAIGSLVKKNVFDKLEECYFDLEITNNSFARDLCNRVYNEYKAED